MTAAVTESALDVVAPELPGRVLRIVQLVGSRQRRGAEIFAYQLSNALRDAGHSVRSIYLYQADGPPLPLRDDDVELGARHDHPLETALGFHPAVLLRLAQALWRAPVDVVQLNGSRTVKYGALLRRLRLLDAATVYRNIGAPEAWVRGRRRRAFYRHGVFPGLDGVVTVSRDADSAIRSSYDVRVPLEHIPNGATLDMKDAAAAGAALRERLEAPSGARVILFVGSLSPEKRVDRLLFAARSTCAALAGACLWIVGDGPLRSELEATAAGLGLSGRVRFLGARTDMSALYAAADLVALTSDTEGVPGVLLEAGLAGRAVLATRVGGVPEVVLADRTGVLVEREDDSALALELTALLRDDERRARLGANAYEWVTANYSMNRIAEAYRAFFLRVLAARRRR